MVTKTYKSNVNEAVLSFNLGKAIVKCSFTGGRDGIPAKFTTSDIIAQLAIEKDARFDRTILLDRVVSDEVEEILGKGKDPKEMIVKGDPIVVNEVVDVNGVIEWLKGAGVPHQSLRSVSNIKKVMEEKNVQFPNVTFPEE